MFRLVNLLSLNGTIKNCTVAHSRQITKAYYMLTHACIHALFIRQVPELKGGRKPKGMSSSYNITDYVDQEVYDNSVIKTFETEIIYVQYKVQRVK